MMNFSFITPLILCSLCCVSVSASDYYTVRGRPGEDVTLLVDSKFKPPTFWFRMLNRTSVHCISVMVQKESRAYFCDGYHSTTEMGMNGTQLYLKIKHVNLSDSGLYFCVFGTDENAQFSVVKLQVEEVHEENPLNVILGGVTAFLTLIISLGAKFMKPPRGGSEDPQHHKNLDSGDLKAYSASIRNRRSASDREVETRVIYKASK